MSYIMPFPEKSFLLDLISRCNSLCAFKQIQCQLLSRDFLRDDLVVNKVVNFLGKSADFSPYACEFLRQIRRGLSSFPYNTLLSNYAICDNPSAAILVYRTMVKNGFSPDMYTFPAVLKACGKFLGVGEGNQIHGTLIRMGFSDDIYVQNSLVHLYGVCGESGDASKVFDQMPVKDVVSWTGIISGFTRIGLYKKALDLFLKMDVEPNSATYVSVLVASGREGCLSLGKCIHGLILKRASIMSIEAGNALIDMYVKCECLNDAMILFGDLPEKDIVSWTSIISGLVQNKRPKEAIELFSTMQTSGLKPDGVILTSVLSACASLGALDYGRWVHEYILRAGIRWDTHVGTAMVDMYAKCGCIDTALEIFYGIRNKNVFTWNALLGGLANHGHGSEALGCFEEMVRSGLKPNDVTFLAVLTACCHSGLVDDGRRFLCKMQSGRYNVSPRLEHYGCMVDLLCKAGLLDEALELVKAMPMKPDVLICGAILSACKARETLELPPEILDCFSNMEFHDSGVHVLLSNIYAANRRWGDVTRIRKLMKEKGISKTPGSSTIEVDGESHEFVAGDTNHPRNEETRLVLENLGYQADLGDAF
ncbi:PREDICTED: pentatricopeptide repeat-containing protein At4g38010 [Tarenaya hassleriana]|uniref:pentatricopeptide repeat-containing protein At4g38010 n=1 Tax=Tarenaya hassleriana TaxID=28532 RepID=UPI00053C4912|nr:PREDICTED: pentatricopeptide repeat-containing protein At4g38010 [Tarenaya hassleriana]